MKFKFFVTVVLLLFALVTAKAQKRGVDTTIYTAVEIQPSFPGGMEKLKQFIVKNSRYPLSNDNERRNTFVQFVVERNGRLTNFKVLRGINEKMDAEAVRLVKAGGRWNPAVHNGEFKRVQTHVLINFKEPKE